MQEREAPHSAAASRTASWAALLCLLAAPAHAAPNIPFDDPRWQALRDAIARGLVADPLGGVQSLPADRAAALLGPAAALLGPAAALLGPAAALLGPAAPLPGDGLFSRVTLRAGAAFEEPRPYSTPAHPRGLAGAIDLSCEHQEGRPCGDGAGAMLELDSALGVGDWLTAATRVRAIGGSGGYEPGLSLDRVYLRFAWGPLSAQVGRDVLALGPAVRSSTLVSDHAAPQDGVRLQLAPVALPFAPWLKVSLFYFLDRLRGPQTFPGTRVDGSRLQLDLFDQLQLGGTRLLQFGGDGAPDIGGFWGFVREHFGRAGTGQEDNNRLELDASLRFPSLGGARIYAEVDYEDTRSPALNSFLHDADHLVGLELRALALGPLQRLFVELEDTSWDSQEHGTFLTGMSNAGRTLGTPLGPDAVSLWLRADLRGPLVAGAPLQISPWAEWLRESSAVWDANDSEGLFVVRPGVYEHRQRLGVDLVAALSGGRTISAGLFAERAGNFAFVAGATRFNGGMRIAFSLIP